MNLDVLLILYMRNLLSAYGLLGIGIDIESNEVTYRLQNLVDNLTGLVTDCSHPLSFPFALQAVSV